jgi:transposase
MAMTTMAEARVCVTAGVDTHLDVHVVAALDGIGGELGVRSFPTTPAGYRAAVGWLRSFGDVGLVGIEGTGSYGAGLTRHLLAEGISVVEVDRPNRQNRRRRGKSDPVDALAAARAAQSGDATSQAKSRNGAVEAIRVLRVARSSAIHDRTQALNQMRALVSTAPDDLRQELRGLSGYRLIVTASALRPGSEITPLSATKTALRELARRLQYLAKQIERLDAILTPLVATTAPALVARYGVGTETAGALLVAAGDNPQRLVSEASFAHLCGVSPIEASSGKVTRHRLNRGGDRHANHALWRIVMTRMVSDPDTRYYVERRTKEGLSKLEIMRCLKRYVAREIYAALPAQQPS